jgi:hypothetical protein
MKLIILYDMGSKLKSKCFAEKDDDCETAAEMYQCCESKEPNITSIMVDQATGNLTKVSNI